MAAVLRVKRKRNEEPVDKLLIACKKLKQNVCDEASSQHTTEDFKELFKFAGTLKRKDEPVSQHIHHVLSKDKLTGTYKKHSVDLTSKARTLRHEERKHNRYKIVSSHRCTEEDRTAAKEGGDTTVAAESAVKNGTDQLHIFDVEPEQSESLDSKRDVCQPAKETIMCNSVPLVREKLKPPLEDEYVYDIYLTSSSNFDFRGLEDVLAVEAFNEDLVYDDFREDLNQDVYEDEDDSNDENNWRNDYPDEDEFYDGFDSNDDHPGFDSDGEPISEIFRKKLHVGYGDDLSSDDDDIDKAEQYPRYHATVDDLEDFDDI